MFHMEATLHWAVGTMMYWVLQKKVKQYGWLVAYFLAPPSRVPYSDENVEIHNYFISRPTIIKAGKQVPTVVLQRPVKFQIKISEDCHDVNFQASYEISRYNVCCHQCHNELFKFGKKQTIYI